jgi:hypothetical protein
MGAIHLTISVVRALWKGQSLAWRLRTAPNVIALGAVVSWAFNRDRPLPGLAVLVILGACATWVHSPAVLLAIAILALFIVVDRLWRTYKWAESPTAYLPLFTRFLRENRGKIGTAVSEVMPRSGEPDTPEYEAAWKLLREVEDRVHEFNLDLKRRLTMGALVREFVSRFLYCFGVLVLGAAIAYLAVWKVWPSTFSPQQPGPNMVDALFFSLTTIATSGISELRPVTSLAKLLVSIQQFCGIALVVLLVAAFSAAVMPSLEAAQKERAVLVNLLDNVMTGLWKPLVHAWWRKKGLPETDTDQPPWVRHDK